MENNAYYNYSPIGLAVYYVRELFGANVTEANLYFATEMALRDIGNRHDDVFFYKGTADAVGILQLPCKAESIEGISYGGDPFYVEPDVILGKSLTPPTSDYRVGKVNSIYYLPGDYIKTFKFLGDRIIVPEQYFNKELNVIYRSEIKDSKGLPMVTETEALAIAHYWNYLDALKKISQGIQDGGMLQMAQQLRDQAISAARVPDQLSQNEMNNLKDLYWTIDTPTFGIPYKPWR